LDINDILGRLVSGEIVMVVQDEPEKPAQVKPKLAAEEQELADALIAIAKKYGKFNEDETGIWAGYEPAKDNVVAHIGVKCANCALYAGNGVCKIIAQKVEDGGKCRFAVIPDGVVKGVYDPAAQMPVMPTNVGKRRMKIKEEPANSGNCPKATRDIATNLKNRTKAIKTATYGPLNPDEPNDAFYKKLATEWAVAPDQARKQMCGNCSMFIVTPEMKSCIQKGVTGPTRKDEWDAIDAAGGLGYCEAFDFKCASKRTCRAWVTGGPITETKSVAVRPSVKALGAAIGSGSMGPADEAIDHDMDGIIFEGTPQEQRAPYKRQSNNKYEMDRRKFVRSELRRQGIKRNPKVQDRSQKERDARAKARAAYDKMTYMAGLEEENRIERGRVRSPATTNPKPADRYPDPQKKYPPGQKPEPPSAATKNPKPADRYPNPPPKKYPPGQTPEGPSPATRNPRPADRYPNPPRRGDGGRGGRGFEPGPSGPPGPSAATGNPRPADRYPNPPRRGDGGRGGRGFERGPSAPRRPMRPMRPRQEPTYPRRMPTDDNPRPRPATVNPREIPGRNVPKNPPSRMQPITRTPNNPNRGRQRGPGRNFGSN